MSKRAISISIGVLVIALIIWLIIKGIGAGADLVIHSVTPPATAQQGHSISVVTITSNKVAATYTAGSSTTRLYLNTSASTAGATTLADHGVPILAPKAFNTWSTNVTIPVDQPLGTNYIGAKADVLNRVNEQYENNNETWKVIVITAGP